tara:strand:+ start:555 stop:734 length:180 start_codon:yes stop_codon:yes gene_type:complete
MQFVKKTSSRAKFLSIIIKLFFVLLVFFVSIFILNKIDFPAPKKTIEKIIPNENFKIVK